jgi:RNA polymerase sigma-70 factor (ECF subfamily)
MQISGLRVGGTDVGLGDSNGGKMEFVSHAMALTAAAELSDEAIVDRVRSGDTALYEILMRRHNQRLYRTIRAILREDRDVEDVMQQTYLDAYTHLHQFKGDAQFATWLTRIAVNRAIRSGRGSRRQLELITTDCEHDPGIEDAPSAGLDPEHIMYGRELNVVLESLLDELPDSFRVVFVLREVEDLSTAETAASLSINEETVKTRLHRAKRMLRDRVDRRLGPAAAGVYPFHLSRCDRVVSAVMGSI